MYGMKYILVTLILALVIRNSEGEKCNEILNRLANDEGLFVQCATRSASNVTTCITCDTRYQQAANSYKTLLDECSDKFFNKNRFNIIYNIYKGLTEIWNKGYCDDCFENGHLSNATTEFKRLYFIHNNCIARNSPNPCSNCTGTYGDLNTFYRKMDEEKKGKICFDLQDQMNQTRLAWSKKYNCCRREINVTLFIISSSVFGSLPLIFYFGMYAYTKRSERNHGHLDSNLDSEDHAAVASSSGISAALLTHPEENESSDAVNHDETNVLQEQSQQPLIIM